MAFWQSTKTEKKVLPDGECAELMTVLHIFTILFSSNVWCIKNRTIYSSKTLLSLVRFLMHQTLDMKNNVENALKIIHLYWKIWKHLFANLFLDSDKDFKSDEICFRYSIWHPKRIKLQCAGKEIRYMCHFGLGDLPKVFFNQSCTFANKFDLHVPNGRDAIACVHAHLTSWVASVRLWSFFDCHTVILEYFNIKE